MKTMEEKIESKNNELEQLGYKSYIAKIEEIIGIYNGTSGGIFNPTNRPVKNAEPSSILILFFLSFKHTISVRIENINDEINIKNA